jgi:uncharacterized protein
MNGTAIADPDEQDRIFARAFAPAFTNHQFHLIVLPTERCNFRCTYCYEDFAIGRMQPWVQEAVIALIRSRASGMKRLHLSWFGGEPLLALDVIERIAGEAERLATFVGFTHVGSATTNASLLTRPVLDRLDAVGVREFQISLDGPQEWHDRTRVRADGHGTFAGIWRNLLGIAASPHDLQVTLRLHLAPHNLEAWRGFMGELDRAFLHDSRFTLLFAPLEHLGGPNDDHLAIFSHDEAEAAIAGLQGSTHMEGTALYAPDAAGDPYVCYAAKPNSLLIRADGRLGKCTVALNDPANHIGQLRADGTVSVENDRLRPWVRGWQAQDWSSLKCPLAQMGECSCPGDGHDRTDHHP